MSAKLKPLSKPEDMKAIPTSEPILVALEPEPTGEETDVVAKTIEQPDPGAKTLQEQLEALQTANAAEKTAREAAERVAAEARQQAEQARQQVTILKTESTDAQYDMMVSSLTSAQSELASAKASFQSAYDAANGADMTAAQEKIGRASAKIVNYEGAVAELDARKKQPQQQQIIPQHQQQDLLSQINSNQNLMPTERDWLTKHQDAYGQRNNELNVGYQHAMRKGLIRGQPEYFEFLDSFMGYQQPEGRTQVSAPVTRDNNTAFNGQRQVPSQITLTPEERDMAKSMGLTDIAYAQQKRNLMIDKTTNPERYGRQS